ncbi:protein FAR1-RELATED SEQUENCE 4-like isoform X2 [Tasmannia lanceolata]|uniref:protein FAR1-RELATED SEQUENCE 4-like isoform X2 n=1 Tax=Tasmannia lanceolata TaxID=3420 RepID=UPI004062A5C1
MESVEYSSGMNHFEDVPGETSRTIPSEEVQHFVGGSEEEMDSPMKDSTPKSKGNDEPRVGMEFQSREDAYVFYNDYSRRIGFGISIVACRRSRRSAGFIATTYACSRFGSKRKDDAVKNPRDDIKIGCKAMMEVKRNKNGIWVVEDTCLEHNHDLLPGSTHLFKSHKTMPTPPKKANYIMHEAAPKIFSHKRNIRRGLKNVVSTQKDCQNQIDKEHKRIPEIGDTQFILDHFMHMQEIDAAFFYAMEVDEKQQLKSVFWADSKCRADYAHFGDVVSFDTTYVTNTYNMPFAPFVGVNHHGQIIFFGCALISDESKATYVWLFKMWLRAMFGRAPPTILTDHDLTIKEAIKEVFPDTSHHFCLWHISQKISQKLSPLLQDEHGEFMKKWKLCIYDSVTIKQFEERWISLMEKFDLTENKWIQSLFEDRQQWVPVFLKNTFFAGMNTTQRGESINAFFDAYVNSHTTLKEFIKQYALDLENRYEKEGYEDFKTINEKPVLKTKCPFESQLCEVYTRCMFSKFQEEVVRISGCPIISNKKEGTVISFVVKDFEAKKDFEVIWDTAGDQISCICRSFEFKGFLCGHAMSVLQYAGIFEIPSQYILKRWSKDMKRRYSNNNSSTVGVQGGHLNSRSERFNDLVFRTMKLAGEGSTSITRYNIVLNGVEELLKKVLAENVLIEPIVPVLPQKVTDTGDMSRGSQSNNVMTISRVGDPLMATTKGAPSKRCKSSTELSLAQKKRRCSHCNEIGHYSRTCKKERKARANYRHTQESSERMGQSDPIVYDTQQYGTQESYDPMEQPDEDVMFASN